MYTPDSFDSGEKHGSALPNRQKTNGQIGQRDDDVNIIVNKKKTKPKISPDSSVGSMDSRAQSECGSIRSSDKEIYPGPNHQGHSIVSEAFSNFEKFQTFKINDFHRSPIFLSNRFSIAVMPRVQIVTTVVIQNRMKIR